MPKPSVALARQASERKTVAGQDPLPWHGGPVPSSAMVASGAGFTGATDRIYRGQSSWQADAWYFYDITPELRFAAGWIGNALSRCVLSPGEIADDGSIVASTDAAVQAALHEMFTGKDGQAAMLDSLGIHLTVAGEAYLVGRRINTILPNGEAGVSDQKVWEVVGVNELTVAGGVWIIDYGSQRMDRVHLAPEDSVLRIWRPHPAKRIEADSPVRTLLQTLSEIEALSQRIYGQTRSQLAGAGVWPIPNDIEFAGMEKFTNKAEGITKLLFDSMNTAVQDQGAASALVPTVISVPPESVDKFREPIQFWSKFDEQVVNARQQAVLRFAVGMDIPPEVIMGMTAGASSSGGTGTGASHWTAWQIEESAIKLHIEPLLSVIGAGITIGYLRDVVSNPRSAIAYNTSALKLQPDRSAEAIELGDRGLITDAAVRKHNGIDETDAMVDQKDLKLWMMRKVVSSSSYTPDQVAAVFKALADITIPDGASADGQLPGRPAYMDPSLDGHPAPRDRPQGD